MSWPQGGASLWRRPVWETDLHNPSFAMFATQCGGHGAKASDVAKLDHAWIEALAFKGPALVEVMTDAELI
jgi:pyruvate oxidase